MKTPKEKALENVRAVCALSQDTTPRLEHWLRLLDTTNTVYSLTNWVLYWDVNKRHGDTVIVRFDKDGQPSDDEAYQRIVDICGV